VRSDEEDVGEHLVLRRPDYDFAPRRMPRERLTLAAGGEASAGMPAPNDATKKTHVRWSLDAGELTITGGTGLSGRFEIVAVDDQKLVLRRCQ
jgi:hypothetical protein